ncbi:MAG TPA: PDZ domain-containing protein [Thermoanaerobaculia bacterium]|nr:PDZ domain-containing protein [Thermoanaerobaculia bacterium]
MKHRTRIAFAPSAFALALAFSWHPAVLRAEEAPPASTPERRVEILKIRGPHDGPLIQPFGKGYLGIELIELTPELLDHFDVKAGAGVMVSRIEPGSPADKAGLEVGDVITEIDGTAVDSAWDVQRQVRGKDAGETASVEFWRKGKLQTLTATIAERERAELDLAPMFLKRRDGKDVVIELDPEHRGRSGERVIRPLDRERGPFWRPREAELETRMKELEKRIAELEKLLEKR